MAKLPWCPRFIVAGRSFVFQYPVTRWIPGERTTGFTAKDADGFPGTEIRLRRYTLGMNIRFTDDEWIIVREFMKLAQTGAEFSWEPNALMTVPDMPEFYNVFLDSPRVADIIRPTRDTVYLHLLTIPIVLASKSVFHAYYFPVT